MKRFALVGLSILCLSLAATTSVKAGTRTEGIPGFGSFQFANSSKTITAKDLVKAAIDAHQLTPDTQTDRGYLNAVEQQLSVTQN
jgi:hypothetical protein